MGNTIQQELDQRLKRRYLDRLAVRLRKLRKDLIGRNWPVLKTDCKNLGESGIHFGFDSISTLAQSAESHIPEGVVLQARSLPGARLAVERLISEIDCVLIENNIFKQAD